ncbi:MAG: DUF4157 domain-containing protein [Bacteroidetes bacterium]|nr:DUF4157 domain-containing protein [Bacteroidota bacterium]
MECTMKTVEPPKKAAAAKVNEPFFGGDTAREFFSPGASDRAFFAGSSGAPLPNDTRTRMESSIGSDFSSVRVHTDSQAAQMNKQLNAQAFTNQNDIYFNSGKYDPHTSSGQHLLAHELTHVVQQTGQSTPSIQREPETGSGKQLDPVFYEMIPTATLRVTLNGIEFNVSADATFRPGPTRPQVFEIILRRLLDKQYKEEYVEALEGILKSNQDIKGVGTLSRSSKTDSPDRIGAIVVMPEAFGLILKFFQAKHLKPELSPEEIKQIITAAYNTDLWIDFQKIAPKEGFRIPAWYSRLFFNGQMETHRQLLDEYQQAVQTYHTTRDSADLQLRNEKVSEIFYVLYDDIVLLESIRKDVALQINPSTQLAYFFIWAGDKDKGVGTTPAVLRTMDAGFKFITLARQHNDLAKDVETRASARIQLLELLAKEYDIEKDESLKLLPPFPSFIVALDINPDNSTITTAKNEFRMVTDFSGIHGNNAVHGMTVAMQMQMSHSWKVFEMPASLKKAKEMGTEPAEMVKLTDDFVKNSPLNLGAAVDTYDPEKSRDREIKMSNLHLGDFVLMALAAPRYEKGMNMLQRPSTAGYPFSVFTAEDLARMSAWSEANQLAKYKEQLAKADPDKKAEIQGEIDKLEHREKTDLLTLTKQDLADFNKLLGAAQRLKAFIEKDMKEYEPSAYYGNKTTDPFPIRLKNADKLLYDVYGLVKQAYPGKKYSDREATDLYIKDLEKQVQDLGKLKGRSQEAYDSFKPGSPTYRVVAGLVKKDDGNLVPLIMIAGYHPDADPANGKYKLRLVDVTFDSPHKGDMIYVSKETGSEAEAVDSVFDKFAGNHKYGKGKIVYRLPNTAYKGTVDSYTPWTTYLEYAIAALGLVLLVAGVIASAGALTPAAAAVVSALGVAVGVVGAVLSIRHLQERKEKGILTWDAETALDIVNIIAGVVVAVGAVLKVTMVISKSVNLLMAIERSRGLLMVYDAVNIGANAFLIHEKVKEDTDAIKALHLPEYEERELLSQVTFEALQQGAMLAVSAYSLGRGGLDHLRQKTAGVSYHSWEQRGWIKEVDGKMTITSEAPPFLRDKMTLMGKAGPKTTRPDEPPVKPPAETGELTKGKTTGENTTEDTGTTSEKTGTTSEKTGTTSEKTGTTSEKAGAGGTDKTAPTTPPTFEEQLPSRWKDPKSRPGRMNDCVKKLKARGIPDDKILAILNNAAEKVTNPSDFFGDLNTFLKNGEKDLGKLKFDAILEGLGSSGNFEAAGFLAVRQSKLTKKNPGATVNKIMDVLTLEDIGALRKRYPSTDDAQWKADLETIATGVKGGRDEIFPLLDEAGEGEKGMSKLAKALEQLGPGLSTRERIRRQFAFEDSLKQTIGKEGDELGHALWQENIKGKNESGQFKIAGSLKGETAGDAARAFIDKHKDQIVNSLMNDAGTDVDPMKWGKMRFAVENTDLIDIQKNNIIGELWAAAKVKGYEKQGFKVVREVTIDILGKNGKVEATAILDAVLLNGDQVAGYREFKSSGTATLEEGTQDVAYARMEKGELNTLRPRGDHAEQAFGAKMINFSKGPVVIDRPGGLIK